MQQTLAVLRGPDPGYYAAFHQNFDLGDFGAVDRLFDRLVRYDVRLANGYSADETYLGVVRNKLDGTQGKIWSQRFAKWQHDSPKSNAALIAAAESIRLDAWSLRGSSIDAKLDPEARRLLNRRLAEAERLIVSQTHNSPSSALNYEILIEIMREKKKPASQVNAIGAEALARAAALQG